MTKLVLIDGYAILHRAYHALPPLTNRQGQMVNAIYGFTSMLLKLISELKPTHIAVAFDREEKTFRRERYANYQTRRKPVEEGLSIQFSMARDLAKAFNIPAYELAGFESDDIIGTIARKANVDSIIIVTGDRDLFQLVDGKNSVYMPSKGILEGKIYKEKDVVEKMGVLPSQIVDYKAFVGDSSDNYPGVPGIGPKTAVDLLAKYENLKNVYKNLGNISQNTREKLEKGRESALLSYELAKIVADCKIDFKEEDAMKWDVGGSRVLSYFDELGFRTLKTRVLQVARDMARQKQLSLL